VHISCSSSFRLSASCLVPTCERAHNLMAIISIARFKFSAAMCCTTWLVSPLQPPVECPIDFVVRSLSGIGSICSISIDQSNYCVSVRLDLDWPEMESKVLWCTRTGAHGTTALARLDTSMIDRSNYRLATVYLLQVNHFGCHLCASHFRIVLFALRCGERKDGRSHTPTTAGVMPLRLSRHRECECTTAGVVNDLA